MSARAWQCTRCGKWSHAQRKPKHHLRWTEDPLPEDIVTQEPHYTGDPDAIEKWEIKCGPFAAFLLVPAEAVMDDREMYQRQTVGDDLKTLTTLPGLHTALSDRYLNRVCRVLVLDDASCWAGGRTAQVAPVTDAPTRATGACPEHSKSHPNTPTTPPTPTPRDTQ